MIYLAYLALFGLAAAFCATFRLSQPMHAWNKAARWERLFGYEEPRPGSIRAWIERRRPALHAAFAWIVTTFFLFSLRKFLLVSILLVLLLSGMLPETWDAYLREMLGAHDPPPAG